jgi:hypothetical protein
MVKNGQNISLTFQPMGFELKDVLKVLQLTGEQLDEDFSNFFVIPY